MKSLLILALVWTVADTALPLPESLPWWSPLVNTGAIGGTLVWFMFRNEPRLRAIEASIERVSRALMVTIMALKNCDVGIQEQAKAIKDEIDTLNQTK